MATPFSGTTAPDAAIQARMVAGYAKLPMAFEINQGQTDARVKFLARGQDYGVFLTGSEAVLSLHRAARADLAAKDRAGNMGAEHIAAKETDAGHADTTAAIVRMRLRGANPQATMVGIDPLPGTSNYFVGKDPARWRTQISSYAKVRYAGVYPGIDLVYYGNQQQLEYDFVLAPGADPNAIELDFSGVDKLDIDADGNLLLFTASGKLVQHKPVIYQQVDGQRREVNGGYAVHGTHAQFKLANYDRRQALTIDPVLGYSTYIGGSSNDYGYAIAVDGSGNAYVTGQTQSANFPTASALQANYAGAFCDAFVVKLNAAGTALSYSTYLGGNSADVGNGIAVDTTGNAYITGYTYSTNFPTTASAPQPIFAGSSDAFVVKLNAAGTLAYSTYLGGDLTHGYGIAVDAGGSAYVTGDTDSTNFPTASALQANNAGGSDAFVVKLNAAGTALAYSTYLGGNDDDYGFGIAVDGSGSASITGYTTSTDFPTASSLQANNAGGSDAFVVRLNADATALVFSTYLGGSSGDFGFGIAVDSDGSVYLTGYTQSINFPVASALQTNLAGASDAIVVKLSAAGALVYSTYLGGTSSDVGYGIAVDSSGHARVVGTTHSTDFPTAAALQAAIAGSSDAFVARLNAAGTLAWSTYLGGGGAESANAIAVDSGGNAYITGFANSTDFPTASPLQAANAGAADAFVAKIVPTYTIGGMASGLSGLGLTLSLNAGAQMLPVGANGGFVFANPLVSGVGYAVTVSTQPTAPSQTCTVANGSGTVTTADIADIAVTCTTNTYTVGGAMTGVAGSGLVLSLNAGEQTLAVAADGNFAFADALASGSLYVVTVSTQPTTPSQTCTVSNDSGTVTTANITDIAVTCTTNTYSVGGTVDGLAGSGLTLQLNGGTPLPISADGIFMFPAIADLSNYDVTVATQPGDPSQSCTITNGSGVLHGADVVDIGVSCVILQAQLSLHIDDGRDYARYGHVRDYVVTLSNSGNSAAIGVTVTGTPSAGLDVANAHWLCVDNDNGGATCTAAGNGPFADTATVPANASVSWLVSVPVFEDAADPDVTLGASAPGAIDASDTDTLVIFRDGNDAPYGDGTSAPLPSLSSNAVLDGAASAAFVLPQPNGSAIEDVYLLRSASTDVRVQIITPFQNTFVRLCVYAGTGEYASAWTRADAGARLVIASVEDPNGARIVLLEGAAQSLMWVLGD